MYVERLHFYKKFIYLSKETETYTKKINNGCL